MVRLTLELEVRDERDADDFRKLVTDWSEAHGARGQLRVGGELCPECGGPMVFDAALQAHVCHHPEDTA